MMRFIPIPVRSANNAPILREFLARRRLLAVILLDVFCISLIADFFFTKGKFRPRRFRGLRNGTYAKFDRAVGG